MKIAVIGATGNVGRQVVEMLVERGFFDLSLFASPKSVGQKISVDHHSFLVEDANKTDFNGFDICVFNTEVEVSEKLVPIALQSGVYVVDSSSCYRLDTQVPLIVPPVNRNLVSKEQKLYAHANCLVSPIATVLAPLHRNLSIKRVNATTYQSTSGAGKMAMDDCWNETKSMIEGRVCERQHFQRQIAFNVIPQVGSIGEDGMTSEEYKIIHELKKVVDQDISITATAVRVPVLVGHSIVLNIEFGEPFELGQIKNILRQASSVQLSDHDYHTPVEIVGSDDVFVGRIRRDLSIDNGLHLWLCSDNLRRGAAADAVEILEAVVALGW